MNIFTLIATLPAGLLSFVIRPDTPAGRAMLYQNNAFAPNAIPDIAHIVEFRKRGLFTKAQYELYCRATGLASDEAERLYVSAINYLSLMEYITLFRREKIDRDELMRSGQIIGFPAATIEHALQLTEFFPSPGDLVRFAVREVYTPDVALKFGLFEDLPPEFIAEAKKAGLPEEQAKNYWGAHWELPSMLQGFEMMHRRVIDPGTMETLLRAQDVMPFWRQKLLDISYRPLTRVDVRRMYGLDVLDEDGVRDSYLDVGYSPENADRMTAFTLAYENRENDGITRSNVGSAFLDDLISREEMIHYFESLGYTQDVIDFWVSRSEYDKTVKHIKDISKNLVDLYITGDITTDEIRKGLEKEGLPARYIDRVLSDVLQQEALRRKVPSKADLEAWLLEGIIVEDYYVEKMKLIGFTDRDIQYYLTEIALKVDTSKRRYLQVAIYIRWLSKNIITEPEFRSITTDMKYSGTDIQNMIAEAVGAATK